MTMLKIKSDFRDVTNVPFFNVETGSYLGHRKVQILIETKCTV